MKKDVKNEILELVKEKAQTISSIKKDLDLDYKNAWRYCRYLYDEGIVELTPPPSKPQRGKPVYVTLKIQKTEEEYLIRILKEIQKKKKLSDKEFANLLIDKPKNYMEDHLLRRVLFKMPYFSPSLIKREISLTSEGEKFIKQHSKKKTVE